MSRDLISRFSQLKAKKEELEKSLVEAKTLEKSAEEAYQRALSELKNRFKVSTLEEARALLEKLKAEAESRLLDLETKLAEYESKVNSVVSE